MIIYIGNILSSKGFNPPPIELLKLKIIESFKIDLKLASDKKNLLVRFIHMNFVFWTNMKQSSLIFIDVYSTKAFYFAFYFSLLCRLLYIPYIPIIHGGRINRRIKNNRWLCGLIFNYSEVNIAPSSYIADIFLRNNYKVQYIPNAIDLSIYPLKKRKEIRPYLLWVRSFHKIYNPQMAIYVLAELLKKYPNAILTMIGPDKDGSLNTCHEIAKSLNIDNQVRFTGYLKKLDWIKLSTNHDIFINTTHIDNMPISILEAMALGLPIVSTNVGGISSFLDHKRNAYLINDDDIGSMTKNIIKLIENPKIAYNMSINAYQDSKNYSLNNIFKDWEKIIKSYVK
ncbi:MAG: glycosyl transferase family 1 [Candidatus Marinimicrobia bacterium]|nr:glycosyl transferase family 1 [Candidatus Neomarinimicrobiota bacterium]|tara:strand:+ start:2625 stop:3647 length:1023 start_codon:yes stop_codon:yes gene_type:complete